MIPNGVARQAESTIEVQVVQRHYADGGADVQLVYRRVQYMSGGVLLAKPIAEPVGEEIALQVLGSLLTQAAVAGALAKNQGGPGLQILDGKNG